MKYLTSDQKYYRSVQSLLKIISTLYIRHLPASDNLKRIDDIIAETEFRLFIADMLEDEHDE